MYCPCEFAAKSVIPSIRALVARELGQVYRLKQEEIASLLGVTQSAVSQYIRNVRGKALKIDEVEEVQALVEYMANGLAENSISRRQIVQKYCEVCRIIREKRLLCYVHQRLDPTYNIEDCDTCIP